MAQVSHVDSDFSSVDQELERARIINPNEHTDESKKSSLIKKVKDKARVTVRKIKDRVKKSPEGSVDPSEDQTEGESVEIYSDESREVSESQSLWEFEEDAQTAKDENKDNLTGSGYEGFLIIGEGKSPDNLLGSFARSGESANSPLVAVPTDYGDYQASVDTVMPPAVIEPTSVSELGEESSSNLGEIPEAKDEEKAAVTEVKEGGADSDLGGFRNTFNHKDLQAIDGLVKPRGYDVNDDSSVKSNTESMDAEGANLGQRDFPPESPKDGTVQFRGIEEDNEKCRRLGSVAEFHDSMFVSSASHDLKPNEPIASETHPGSSPIELSRGAETGRNQSSPTDGNTLRQLPPAASDAEPHKNKFSSAVAIDLKPSPTDLNDKPSSTDRNQSSTTDGNTDETDGNTLSQLPPAASDAELHKNKFSSAVASDLKRSPTDLNDNKFHR